MIALSSQRLYPRPIRREKTLEQIAAEDLDARREALHLRLHDHFKGAPPIKEDTYGGDMNKDVEDSDAVYGCELEDDFAGWCQTHRLSDHEEGRRRYQLWWAIDRLETDLPVSYEVIAKHSRTHMDLRPMAEDWHKSDRAVTEAWYAGLDYLLSKLQEAA